MDLGGEAVEEVGAVVLTSTSALSVADVCVVGSGPAGIVTSLELARRGVKVTLVESGEWKPTEAHKDLSVTNNYDPMRHAPMELATSRQVGGASNLWGGRCVPFDPVEFELRAHAAGPGWPVSFEELEGYFQKASDWFQTGKAAFSSLQVPEIEHMTIVPGLPDGEVLSSTLERWSLPTNFRKEYGNDLRREPTLELRCGLTCVEVVPNEGGGEIDHLVCKSLAGEKQIIKAKHYVLAAGALESTRILLASNRVRPEGLGNHSGHLGRYYMGHISGRIAKVRFSTDPAKTAFAYERDSEGVYLRHRFAISAEVQQREQITNVVTWLVNPEIADPAHGSGILSFAYLVLSSPLLGPRLVSEALRQSACGEGPRRIAPHLKNMLWDLPATLAFIPSFGWKRFISKRKAPGFFVRSKSNEYLLHYHGEQVPNWESSVSLADECDALGMPKLAIDLRYSEEDVRGVLRTHEILDEHLRRHGVGELEYVEGDLRQQVWDGAADGYHQAGTTRMSRRPEDGVVDEHCQVHDISNLHVASSSVFVTSSQANSTFMIVVFALRLVDRLMGRIREGG